MRGSLLIALAVAGFSWSSFFARENTRVLTERGIRKYEAKQHAEAAAILEEVRQRKESHVATFNAGTAAVAAGETQRGVQQLRSLSSVAPIAADALFNAGNAALDGEAVEEAIRAYQDALRINPSHQPAKRNLEIALRRLEQQPRDGRGKGDHDKNRAGGGDGDQPQPPAESPQPPAAAPQRKGETDAERLLRAVEQQEREELSRMRKARARERQVGW